MHSRWIQRVLLTFEARRTALWRIVWRLARDAQRVRAFIILIGSEGSENFPWQRPVHGDHRIRPLGYANENVNSDQSDLFPRKRRHARHLNVTAIQSRFVTNVSCNRMGMPWFIGKSITHGHRGSRMPIFIRLSFDGASRARRAASRGYRRVLAALVFIRLSVMTAIALPHSPALPPLQRRARASA